MRSELTHLQAQADADARAIRQLQQRETRLEQVQRSAPANSRPALLTTLCVRSWCITRLSTSAWPQSGTHPLTRSRSGARSKFRLSKRWLRRFLSRCLPTHATCQTRLRFALRSLRRLWSWRLHPASSPLAPMTPTPTMAPVTLLLVCGSFHWKWHCGHANSFWIGWRTSCGSRLDAMHASGAQCAHARSFTAQRHSV